jgi:hypothetical protein
MNRLEPRHGLVALVLAATLGTPLSTPAHASGPYEGFGDAGMSLLHGRWMSISPFIGGGASQLGDTDAGYDPTAIGLRYYERKGFITGVMFALMNTVAGSMAASSPKSVNTYRSGNWIVTETVYRSEAEKQQMLADTAAASEAMMNAEDQSFELEIYSTSLPGGGEVSGYKLNMSFGIEIAEAVMLDVGMGFGSVDARMIRDDRQGKVHLSYFGMPFRLNVAGGPFLFYFAWDWNWLGDWTGHGPEIVDEATRYKRRSTWSHLELGVQTVLFDRLLVQAGVTTPTIDSADFGYRASVGLRF